MLAHVLKQRIERTHHVAGVYRKTGAGAGKVDESLEGVAETPDALQVMAERMRLRPGAHDEHVARAHSTVETPVDHGAVNQPAQAQHDSNQAYRDQHDAAGNLFDVNQVERAGEKQAGGKAGLHAQLLLMQQTGQARGGIQMQPPADHDKHKAESAHQRQQDLHRTAMNKRAAPDSLRGGHRAGLECVQSGKRSGREDGESIHHHPQPGWAPRAAREICRRFTRKFRGRRCRSRSSFPEFRCRHKLP